MFEDIIGNIEEKEKATSCFSCFYFQQKSVSIWCDRTKEYRGINWTPCEFFKKKFDRD